MASARAGRVKAFRNPYKDFSFAAHHDGDSAVRIRLGCDHHAKEVLVKKLAAIAAITLVMVRYSAFAEVADSVHAGMLLKFSRRSQHRHNLQGYR